MKYDHVVTFRMDADLLGQLDNFTHTHYYWKRSWILVSILTAFFKFATKGTRFAIVRAALERKDKYVLKLEKVEEKEVQNA